MSPLARTIRAVGLVTAIAGASVVMPLLPAPAFASAGGNPSVQDCKQIQAAFPDVNLYGLCVGADQSDGRSAGNALFFCRAFFLPTGEYENMGSCVSDLRHLGF